MTARPVLLYTTAEAADRLRVSESFLKRGATSKRLQCTRVGRFIRWSDANLEKIVADGQCGGVVSPLRARRAS